MPNPYQQKARQRKLVYFALIGVLLTGSLVHRKWVVEKQANDLQLRETTRGEVELTGSAVRLMLTGSRGLVVPALWFSALEMQKKHQWSEMEFVVDSISKLQPYFITPWLFQSWNLAFNVAVEFDRPYDKYRYMSKGLKLLAEGERRNQGSGDETAPTSDGRPRFPGNPELRHTLGFFYQLKIGTSDERNTMRCLLDLSTIHPSERNPDDFWTRDERGRKQVLASKFNDFFAKYPRLVRRLRDQLRYTSRQQIVTFLEKNQNVPMRFKPNSSEPNQAALEEPRHQFPILPPRLSPSWPDANETDLALDSLADDGNGETLDVFLVARTWYEYAQRPLPEPSPNPAARDLDYDRLHYRMPKSIAVQIFRGYPARAQGYIAENLQTEGWFDSEGWAFPEWADRAVGDRDAKLEVVGAKKKFDSGRAWRNTFDRYRDYGTKNGLYLTPDETTVLERLARRVRERFKIQPGDRSLEQLSSELRHEYKASYDAHMTLAWNKQYREMTNYDAHLYQAEGEMDRMTVAARKVFHQAEQARRSGANDEAVQLYEEGFPLWVVACIRHPRFASQSHVQEDAYEMNWHYTRLSQRTREHIFQPVLLAMAQLCAWPHPSWEEWKWVEPSQKPQIGRVKTARGPLEGVRYYTGPAAQELGQFLVGLSVGAGAYHGTAFVPPVVFPDQQELTLTRWARRDEPPAFGWTPLITPEAIIFANNRLGIR